MFSTKEETIERMAFKFTTRAAARDFMAHGGWKAMALVLGDDARFWVVTVGQAQFMAKRGYTVEYR